MTYLLDTNVVSELRKPPRRADPAVPDWARRRATSDLSISVITVMEIEIGVARVERRDAPQGRRLRRWFERGLLAAFDARILPLDLAVVRRAAAMHVPDPRPERDALIAAIAASHLVVVTRDVADFEPLGVEMLDPWHEPGPR